MTRRSIGSAGIIIATLLAALVSGSLFLNVAAQEEGQAQPQKEQPQASPQPERQEAAPTPEPEQPTAPASRKAKPLVVPKAEKDRKNPVPVVPEAIESGRNLFTSQCGMCHGARGDGRGDLAKTLKLTIPDFTDARQQARRTDGELFYILGHGHGEMPAETRLVDQQKWEIVLYIRTLAPAPRPKP